MVLRVTGLASGGPVLTMPVAAPLSLARAFLNDHEDWLRRQLATRPRVMIADGTPLPFGDATLTVRHDPAARRARHAGGELWVPGRAEDLAPRVAIFLREAAREACARATDHYCTALGRPARRLTLRDPRGRWGSCTARGDLMFSWRLVLAPRAVLEYVVAHEVAHLAELNHSPRFWAVVARLRPDYAGARDWLKRDGARLHDYDFTRAEAPGPAALPEDEGGDAAA